MIFSFGQSEYERLEVDVSVYEHESSSGDYDEDGWLSAEIRVSARGFRGEVQMSIMMVELVVLLAKLRSLYQSQQGTVEFDAMEGQLGMKLTRNDMGHVRLDGMVADQSDGNRLLFTLDSDQTQLKVLIRELEKVISHFPGRLK